MRLKSRSADQYRLISWFSIKVANLKNEYVSFISRTIYIYIIRMLVVTKLLCGYVSNQVQYNMESAQYQGYFRFSIHSISCLNFWDETCWFLSLRVFELLSSSLLLFPQRESSWVRQTPWEGRRIYRPKCCGNNNKDEDNSLKSLNDKNSFHILNCQMIVVLQKNSMKPWVAVYIPWIKYIYIYIYIYIRCTWGVMVIVMAEFKFQTRLFVFHIAQIVLPSAISKQ